MKPSKQEILEALTAWVNQRPGLDRRDYGDSATAYRTEAANIRRDLHDAQALLNFVATRDGITVDNMLDGFRAFSGRLQWTDNGLVYCTGQYWPTEYRAAACAVLASVIWNYYRQVYKTGDQISKNCRDVFGRGIGKRWFR